MAINALRSSDLGQMTWNGAQCLGIDFVLMILEDIKSVASRPSWKILENVKGVASRES